VPARNTISLLKYQSRLGVGGTTCRQSVMQAGLISTSTATDDFINDPLGRAGGAEKSPEPGLHFR